MELTGDNRRLIGRFGTGWVAALLESDHMRG